MKRKLLKIFIFIFGLYIFPQSYTEYLSSGLDAYARSDWSSAVFSFQKAIENSTGSYEEASYWLIMSNASAKNYKAALDGAEIFLKRYPASTKSGEVMYQQGRIFCLRSEHEKSINILYEFLRKYPKHVQAPSAYYWIGENLYMAGRLKEARSLFSRVITDFPASAKVDPAKYKIAVIDQSSIYEELLKLLKISHEELLKLSEEYEKSKRVYDQTILAYQKQIGEINRNSRMAELAEQLQIEKRKNEEFYEKLTVLELKNKELLADLDKLNAVLGTKEEKPQSDGTVKNQEIDKKQAALEALKAKAKQLENMYEQISEENKK